MMEHWVCMIKILGWILSQKYVILALCLLYSQYEEWYIEEGFLRILKNP